MKKKAKVEKPEIKSRSEYSNPVWQTPGCVSNPVKQRERVVTLLAPGLVVSGNCVAGSLSYKIDLPLSFIDLSTSRRHRVEVKIID